MSLQDFTHSANPNDHIFHSNAYAKVAQGGTLGSTNSQTFEQRREIHRNRQAVSHYGNSLIARGDMKEQVYADATSDATQSSEPMRPAVYQRFSSRNKVPIPQRPGTRAPSRPAFREPPGRGYNPFG